MNRLLFVAIFLSLTTAAYAQSGVYPSPYQQQQELYQQQKRDEMNLRQMRRDTTQQQQNVNKEREMLSEQYKLDEIKKMKRKEEEMKR